MAWQKSGNGEDIQPADIEQCRNIVIVRRNFKRIEATEEMPAHYEWTEWQMTKDQYEIWAAAQEENAALEDALIELASIVIGG